MRCRLVKAYTVHISLKTGFLKVLKGYDSFSSFHICMFSTIIIKQQIVLDLLFASLGYKALQKEVYFERVCFQREQSIFHNSRTVSIKEVKTGRVASLKGVYSHHNFEL